MYQFVRYEKQDEIAIVTINRPEALNSLNRAVIGELEQVITEMEHDDSIRAMILTGEGRSFTLREQQELVELCAKGNRELIARQREILGAL